MYHLYILYSESRDRYYVGRTADLNDRIARHNQGRSTSTRTGIPWKLVYSESFPDKASAYQRERQIKARKSRTYIEALIADSSFDLPYERRKDNNDRA